MNTQVRTLMAAALIGLAMVSFAPTTEARTCTALQVCATANISACGLGCVFASGTAESPLNGAGTLRGTTSTGAVLFDQCVITFPSTLCSVSDGFTSGGIAPICGRVTVTASSALGTVSESDSC